MHIRVRDGVGAGASQTPLHILPWFQIPPVCSGAIQATHPGDQQFDRATARTGIATINESQPGHIRILAAAPQHTHSLTARAVVQLDVAVIEFSAENQRHLNTVYIYSIQFQRLTLPADAHSPIAIPNESIAHARTRPDTEPMSPEEALFANDSFYLAFAARDIEHMDALWARHHPVICLHPGWPALTDRAEIVDSWQRILSNPAQKPIDVYNAEAYPLGDSVAVVCYEELGENVMVATNLFITEADRIVLAHHQAGPCGQPPERNL